MGDIRITFNGKTTTYSTAVVAGSWYHPQIKQVGPNYVVKYFDHTDYAGRPVYKTDTYPAAETSVSGAYIEQERKRRDDD